MTNDHEKASAVTDGELYQLLAENLANHAIVVLDCDRRVRAWPRSAERLFGYTQAEMKGRSSEVLFPPEDLPDGTNNSVAISSAEGASAGERQAVQRWYLRRDGTRFWGSGQIITLRDGAGNVRGLTQIIRDDTELRRAEDELADRIQEAEKRRRLYEAALSNTPDLAYVFDLNHRFAYANEVLLTMWGQTWDEAIGKNCLELGYEPWHAAMHDREIDQVIATRRPIKGEVPFHGTFGRRIYEYIFVPVLDESGQIEAVAGTTRDVTERRQAEEQVQRSEQHLRSILESITDAFVAIDAQWRFEYVNGQAERICGMRREDLLGKSLWEAFPDLIGSRFEGPYRRAMAERRPLRIEGPFQPLKGWFEVKTFPVIEGGMSFYFRDLSEQRRTEEALRDADRRKDEFLAMLAHELRNPLAPIRTGLDLLALNGSNDEIIGPMQQQVEVLVRLVDDLLDVSRIMRGKVDLRQEEVEITAVIHQAIETVRPQIESLQQNLIACLPEKPIWLQADPVRLAQAIANLLHNASKYNRHGGGITLTVTSEGDEVVIQITDTGIGIEPELLPRVFDLFIQATRSIDRSQGGLGVGLTVVKNLIEMHGGTVSATSAGPELGSTFMIHLPILTTVHTPSSRTAEGGPKRDRRILIVDDNVPSAKMLARLLEKLGRHEVFLAHDGPEALEAAQQHCPEIIFLDLGLPKMSGYEVAQRLRQQPPMHEPLIVALTGYGSEEDRQKSHHAGCDDHLVKPPGVDALKYVLNHPNLPVR